MRFTQRIPGFAGTTMVGKAYLLFVLLFIASVARGQQSTLAFDPSFIYNTSIGYIQYQTVNINPGDLSTSTEIARYQLTDGPDADGLPTVINSLTFDITGSQDIRQIALYNGATEMQEQTLSGSSVTFSGLNITTLDDFFTTFSIRVSFKNIGISDHDVIRLKLTGYTQPGASTSLLDPATLANALTTPINRNIIDVVATKLDFTTQPSPFAGINQFTQAGVVEARDPFNARDVDVHEPVTVVAPSAAVNGTFSFSSGVLDLSLSGFFYGTPGDGTLTVATSGGLNTQMNNVVNGLPNVSIPCSHVDVIHVQTNVANGILSFETLLAGNVNVPVFAITFNAPYIVPGEPKLQQLRFSFDRSVSNIFNSFKIIESINGVSPVGPDVVSMGVATVSSTPLSLTVNFIQPRDFSVNPSLTYFLVVDINPNVTGITPPLQISVTDAGMGSPTDGNIVTSTGSATANALVTRFFAGIAPPSLVNSIPAKGQIDVSTNTNIIQLTFTVPVWTLDGIIQLHDAASGSFVVLTALNGQYQNGIAGLAQPIQFAIPPGFLLPDHTYYITIAPGNQILNTGIVDANNNLFPGINSSSEVFFKTSDGLPPKLLGVTTIPAAAAGDIMIVSSTPTGAVITATFDKRGKAYFLVLANGSPPPTNAHIINNVPYPIPGAVVAQGSFPILETNPVPQSGVITGTFTPSTVYDVWVAAESYSSNGGILTPIPTVAPYGGVPLFQEGAVGPTQSFVAAPFAVPGIQMNNPLINFCSNSFQVMNQPIIISETSTGQFNVAAPQQVAFSLPSGFQFDTSTNAGVPVYGSVTTTGADFQFSTPSLVFMSNTTVKIFFINIGTASLDKIVISGLRIKSTGAVNGFMYRFGGNGLPALADATPVAGLNAVDGAPVSFTNSYSLSEGELISPLTNIPDNFNNGLPIDLIAQPPPGDFGFGTFDGTGVSGNYLVPGNVILDLPFPLTLTYTYQNGCVSTNTVQYLVYDHNMAIPITGGQGPFCEINPNYIIGQTNPAPVPSLIHVIPYNSKPGYYLESLTASIPPALNQIILGPIWNQAVQALPVRGFGTILSGFNYYNYSFELSSLLNINSISGGVVMDPYQNFIAVSPQGNQFVNGGSLGYIEFSGTYRLAANPVNTKVFKQNVEVFIPPIPIVEVGLTNMTSLDVVDPLNVPGSGPYGGASNKGTPVFCSAGGIIQLYGYPLSASGVSTGTFSLFDAQTGIQIGGPGFTDNGNGTAMLDPALIQNGYNDIKVVYNYRQNSSPCIAQAYQIVRIVPSGVNDFVFMTPLTPQVSSVAAVCSWVPMTFIPTGPVFPPGTSTVSYQWNFDDPASSNNIINAHVSLGIIQQHVFTGPRIYQVKLTSNNNWGCASTTIKNISVGDIPTFSSNVSGVALSDQFNFESQIQSLPIDPISLQRWDFGDATPFVELSSPVSALVQHVYSQVGAKEVRLTVTTQHGCVNQVQKSIVVLDSKSVTSGQYFEDFESGPASWISISGNNGTPSWEWGVPGAGKTVLVPDLVKLGLNTQNTWSTSRTGKYGANEKSYLISPKINIPQGPLIVSFNQSHDITNGDGIVLQYSTDNLNVADPQKVWNTLGVPFDGGYWYESFAIPANPGDQSIGEYGWTGRKTWDRSGYALTISPATAVIFRFALGTMNNAPADGMIMDNFRIGTDTGKPVITATKTITGINLAKNDTVKFKVTEEAALRSLKFYYKNLSSSRWDSVDFSAGVKVSSKLIAMASSGVKDFTHKEFTVAFDHNFYDKIGIKYYVSAKDLANNSEHSDTTKFLIKFETSAASPPIPGVKFGGAPSDWRMFSIPYILDDNSIAGIFESKLGPPGSKTWRLLRWDNPVDDFDGYKEDGSLTTIDRGKGYWFNAVGGLNRDLLIGKGVAPDVSNLFVMQLKKGWNQIGNPYPVAITWPDVLTFNHSNSTESIKKYTGGTTLASGTFLDPYEGAYVFSDADVNFRIPISGNNGGRVAQTLPEGWGIDLTISKGEYSNTISGIGMYKQASDNKDIYDGMRVPRFSNYIDLTFQHSDYFYPHFSRDIVAEKENHVWKFSASTNIDGGVAALQWDKSQIQALPSGKELWLYDVTHETVLDMKGASTYSFEVNTGNEFKVYYGSPEFIKEAMVPSRIFVGDNFPNPLTTVTTVAIVLPGSNESFSVACSLYDNMGRLIAPLREETMPSGFHQISINRSALPPMAPGLYLFQVRIQGKDRGEMAVKKLMVE